ncbi:MAG: filamentous hemagglutinin N-terminal domain-containing protein [Rhodopila sp.]
MNLRCFDRAVPVLGLAMVLVLPIADALGQGITVDGRLSPAQTLMGPNYAIGAQLGRQVGSNLFHSFGAFGLNRSQTATFSGPGTVANVIGRVTGGAQSSIDGTVRSTMPGANLYLINPAGVVFGPNARVDVSGSFHASSADYLRLQDGARFQATNPDASSLTSAPPAAFGFLTPNPRPVTVSGATLRAAAGGTLGLVGGPVTIRGGVLQAPGGTVHITSAAGPGEVLADPRGGGPAPTVAAFGPVRVEGGARVAVSDAVGQRSGGSVFIRAGALDVTASEIDADNHGPGPGGVVSLRGDRAVTISDRAHVYAGAHGAGRGADIGIGTAAGGTVVVADAAVVGVSSLASGAGGALSIAAPAGTLVLRNGAVVSSTAFESGNAGGVTVQADSISLQDGGLIFSQTYGPGRGGDITVTATGSIGISSSPGGGISGIGVKGASTLGLFGHVITGDAGRVVVRAGKLILNESSITSDTSSPGRGGEVIVQADSISLQGVSSISSDTSGSGRGGEVTVQADSISLQDGGRITSETRGLGQSGDVTVTATGSIEISSSPLRGRSSLISTSAGAGIFFTAVPSTGDAGRIVVRAGKLILNRSFITSDTVSDTGRGGEVTVQADSISLQGGGGISSKTYGARDAGRVVVQTGNLTILNGSYISSDTSGPGRGGDVAVTATGSIEISSLFGGISASAMRPSSGDAGRIGDAGRVVVRAGKLILNTGSISSNTFGPGRGGEVAVQADSISLQGGDISSDAFGPGRAGEVAVQADSISLQDGSGIYSRTFFGPGRGGNIAVTATGLIEISSSPGGFPSSISTSASGPFSGDAGRIVVRAGKLILNEGFITSDTFSGPGRGGEVAVQADSISLQGGGGIFVGTFGPGNGGSVTVRAGSLAISRGGQVSASTSDLGDAGVVTVTASGAIEIDGSGTTDLTGISSRAERYSAGNAGQVVVSAGRLTLRNGGQIASTTAGTGAGGAVSVSTPGALLLEGQGVAGTQIAASAIGEQSGAPGTVTVSAGTVTVRGGAQIASTTASTREVGTVATADVVKVTGASYIHLDGPGSQIATTSTGTRDAGSMAVSAPRLSLRDGASISTQAQEASGGNIIISLRDLLYLQRSSITTSVNGALGNGGNIIIDPRFVVLNQSVIRANAVGGSGGNIRIRADQLVQSADSEITATSQLGLSGEIAIAGQPVNLTSSLVVLASELRAAAALLHESCAAQGARPRSSLVVAGRGGQRHDPETTLPALYIANRPVRAGQDLAPEVPTSPRHTSITLSTRCE